jgi:predicted ATPase
VLGKLRRLDAGLLSTLPAVLTLLDVPVDDPQWYALDPPQRRQRTLEACKHLLLRASRDQPVLLVMENLHWVDTETQAFLDSLVDSLTPVRIILLVNYRPEYHHGWGSKTCYTQLRLDPLPPARAEELLHGLLGAHPALTSLCQLLIARTEGNPFFLEESVRTLVETGILVGEPGAYHLVQALPAMQMPTNVQTVLSARIDRLPPEIKRLLHMAAVIGMEVPVPLLQAIAELDGKTVHDGLRDLQAAEFVYETRLFPEHAYTFKHALTHEVAYGSLPPERRQALHARITEALETLAGDRLADYVDRLAAHAFRGEVWDKALLYCRQAGVKAIRRPAYRETVVFLEQALTATQHLPAQRDTLVQALDLCVDLRSALLGLGELRRGFGYLRQATTLAEDLGEQQRLVPLYCLMIHHCWSMGMHDDALAYSQRALALATARGEVFEQAVANGRLGTVYLSLGDYRRAIDAFRQSIAPLEGELRYKRFTTQTESVRSRVWLVDCLRELGEFAQGLAYGEEAAQLADAAADLHGAIITQFRIGHLSL